MLKVFNSDFIVTQVFGSDHFLTINGKKIKASEYYSKFGLPGHEGLDLVPSGSDWSVYSLPFKGVVVKDIDMKEKGGAYGKTTTIWYPEIGEAYQFCHLESNVVSIGQELEPGAYIGQMGSTGNTAGAHLHLNRFKVNKAGVRLNTKNGYWGGIDPLSFLTQDLQPKGGEEEEMPKYLNDLFKENSLDINNEPQIRDFFDKAKKFDNTNKDLTNARIEIGQLTEKLENCDQNTTPSSPEVTNANPSINILELLPKALELLKGLGTWSNKTK